MLKRLWAAIKAGVNGVFNAVVDAAMTLFGMKAAGVLAPAAGLILGVGMANDLLDAGDPLVTGVATVVCALGGLALGAAVAPLLVGAAEMVSCIVLGWRMVWAVVDMLNVGLGDDSPAPTVRQRVAARARAYELDFAGMLEADGVPKMLARTMARGMVEAVLLTCEAADLGEARTLDALDELMGEYCRHREEQHAARNAQPQPEVGV